MSSNSRQKTPLHYSRKKGSIEISGDPKDVKALVWVELITSKLVWIILLIVLILLPTRSVLPILWKFIRDRLLLILLPVQAVSLLLLSG